MIFPSRKPAEAGEKIRALNLPRPATVEADEKGLPRAVALQGRWLAVDAIFDVWRIDDEWWREPLIRRYFLVALEGGVLRTLFQDLLSGQWYEQRY
jgi:hypothetical protein